MSKNEQNSDAQSVQYGKTRKKVVFYSTDHEHARFIAKAQVDGIKHAKFISAILEAYVNDDPNIMAFVENCDTFKISKKQKQLRKRDEKKKALQNVSFNLDNKDIEEIFDILEAEDD